MKKKRSEIENEIIESFIENIGLTYSKFSCDDIIPDKLFCKEVKKIDSTSANILKFSPAYFVMPARVSGDSKEKIQKFQAQTCLF